MVIRLSPRLISVVLLALLAILAATLVLRATPEGLGLSDDSIAYIAGARSMLAGNGYREAWLATNGPVTHFPPAYPSVLTFLGWFGLEPLRGARFLGAVLFGFNTALLGILGWRMTRSLVAGLLLPALFVLGDSFLRLHSMALSEPLFIFLSLLSMWMFDLYRERDAHWLWLVACGSLIGMAYLTRYAALALVATYVIALLVLHKTWRRRFISVGILLVSIIPWIGGWTLRNAAVGGTVTNRVLVWHPLSASKLETALHTASSFMMPVEAWRQALSRIPGLWFIVVAAVLSAILVYVVVRARRLFTLDIGKGGEVLSWLNALYVICYLASVLAAMSAFDASTKFKLRILSPAYIAFLILVVALGAWAWKRRRGLVIAALAAVLALSTYGQVMALRELSKGGQGYASFKWYDSQAMAFLKALPPDIMIYTNEPGAVYLYTGRAGSVLPDRVDPVTASERPGFEQGREQMQSEVLAGRAVLALFSGGDTPAQDAAALSDGLHLVLKAGGAEIYGALP
ncbi:MAG TPA: phospholipid carrier-dependent glycosyltransferase [Anaerolineales bacterium]